MAPQQKMGREARCAERRSRNEARRAAKRGEAESRQADRDERSPQEQLKLLDARLGPGKGAKKERARLFAVIEEAKKAVEEAKAKAAEEAKAKKDKKSKRREKVAV